VRGRGPCGKLGKQWLADAKVTPSVDTNEPDVRSLLTKLESGDLDAGWSTHRREVGRRRRRDRRRSLAAAPITAYPIAALTGGSNADAAAASSTSSPATRPGDPEGPRLHP